MSCCSGGCLARFFLGSVRARASGSPQRLNNSTTQPRPQNRKAAKAFVAAAASLNILVFFASPPRSLPLGETDVKRQ